MYKVLIADDEPWVVYGLERLISWEDHGFQICGTAANGDEAFEKCLALRPDVLISDIRMPGLSGIALLEQLRETIENIEVIFVSGYSSFDYAQKALRLGAADYLVKQVTAKQLAEAVQRLKSKLDEKLRKNIESDFYALIALLDDENKVSISELLTQHKKPINYKYYRMVNFTGKSYIANEHNFIFKTGRDKFSALVGYSSPRDLGIWLKNLHKHQYKAGISGRGTMDSLLFNLFREADIAFYTALMVKKDLFCAYKKKAGEEKVQYIVDTLSALEAALAQNDIPMCHRYLDDLKNVCKNLLLDRTAQIYNALTMIFKQYTENEIYNYRRLASDYAGIDEIFDFFHQCLDVSDSKPTSLFRQIMQYVDAHYTDDLRLTDIAKKFHFAPNYFSTVFKKIAGVPFTKYITDKRMDLAKSMLTSSNLSLQEIVEHVGYNDYFQFNKTFKRETGVAPGQYRKEFSNENTNSTIIS